jgi:hypothetical protein
MRTFEPNRNDIRVPDRQAASCGLAGGNGNTLAALVAAPLEDQTAILGTHTDQEPVGSATTPVVGLKSNAHNTPTQSLFAPWGNSNATGV